MGMRCKDKDGVVYVAESIWIKDAKVAAITVCNQTLSPVFVPDTASKIYVLINDTFVDYVEVTGGESDHEANNLIATLQLEGFSTNTFTDVSDDGINTVLNELGTKGILFIPELENDGGEGGGGDGTPLNDAISTDSKNLIKNWVDAGGSLVMFFPGGGSLVPFLNSIFSFNVNVNDVDEPVLLTEFGAASSIFGSGPSTLPISNATSSLYSLPEGSHSIYSGGGEDESVVTLINYGRGTILVFGFDWYDAAPIGVQDGGWLDVLNLFVDSII